MSEIAAGLGALYAILLWFHFRLLDAQKRQQACAHARGHVASYDDHRTGHAWHLNWVCPDCGLQVMLRDLVAVPGKDLFWFTRGSAKWEEAHLEAIRQARELL